jgi:hypothetical protein
MEAVNVPSVSKEVLTFWEGEVIDNVNHSFFTKRWSATLQSDLLHWSKFPAFSELKLLVGAKGCPQSQARLAQALAKSRWVFLRIKEQFFVGPSSHGLTIAGFYYCCLDRRDGSIVGYYYDPDSSPNQQLLLAPCRRQEAAGRTFGEYSFR